MAFFTEEQKAYLVRQMKAMKDEDEDGDLMVRPEYCPIASAPFVLESKAHRLPKLRNSY